MTTRVLITGACGFIGHHVALAMSRSGFEVVCLDRLDSTSTQQRLRDLQNGTVVWHDLKSPINDLVAAQIGPIDAIFHLAASTHVDRSIQNSIQFVLDNVLGTAHLLEYARFLPQLKLFLNFSTDEVFGPAPPGISYKDHDRYDARNPYSATKAGAEELAHAYANTYGIPVVSTHCMNVFGERQHPEKFVPLVIGNVLTGRRVYIHSDKTKTKPGSRFYIYSSTVAELLVNLLNSVLAGSFSPPDKLNIPGTCEVDNLDMALRIAQLVGKPLEYELIDFHSSRPGHDLRYALDGSKIENLGILTHGDFDEQLSKTVSWYLENKDWLLL